MALKLTRRHFRDAKSCKWPEARSERDHRSLWLLEAGREERRRWPFAKRMRWVLVFSTAVRHFISKWWLPFVNQADEHTLSAEQ